MKVVVCIGGAVRSSLDAGGVPALASLFSESLRSQREGSKKG